MNSRLLELAQQAGLSKNHANDREYTGNLDWRRLSELIIQDCISQVEKTYAGSIHSHAGTWNSAVQKAVLQIKQHFGVEEPVKRLVIGYCERDEGYYPMYAPEQGRIVTHAFILCKYCNGAISPVAGPRSDAVCLTCYEKDPDER